MHSYLTKKQNLKNMINFFEKDKKRRKLYIKNLKKRSALKTILKNKNIVINERYDAQIKLLKMNTNSSKIRLKKRCVLTGRASGIVGPFNISRIKLRDILGYGLIPGVQKSSW